MAEYVSIASKDPGTKTGAVIVDPDRRIVSVGYNGLPAGVADTPERLNDRETKLRMTVHCEVNAVLFAGRSVKGCTLYTWPFGCCAPCAAQMIQAGIKRLVHPPMPERNREHWEKDCKLAKEMFAEAGVEVTEIEGT